MICIGRHDRIRDAITKLCQDANIRHRVEPKNLTDSNRLPADILVYGIGNTGLALDVGIESVSPRFPCKFHSVSDSVHTNEQLVAMIQLVQSIHCTLFANQQLNHLS